MARAVGGRAEAVLALAATFRRHGFDGASLSTIGAETGLGRGSLYHFFPGGKEEMAAAVLAEVQLWFEREVFAPLREPGDPDGLVGAMLDAVAGYFASRQLVCLYAVAALGGERERDAASIRRYFVDWVEALTSCLARGEADRDTARALAVDIVATIQGALVLSRALDDPPLLLDAVDRLRERARTSQVGASGGDAS